MIAEKQNQGKSGHLTREWFEAVHLQYRLSSDPYFSRFPIIHTWSVNFFRALHPVTHCNANSSSYSSLGRYYANDTALFSGYFPSNGFVRDFD
jgi:hypothetical protein